MRSMKVCLVAFHAYSLFDAATAFPFGGSEVRASLLARGLARLGGHEVIVVVCDHGQASPARFGEVTVVAHPCYGPPPAPWMRLVHRLARREACALGGTGPLLGRALLRRRTAVYRGIDADVYVTIGVSDPSAELLGFCRRAGRPGVLLLGSDMDLSPGYVAGSCRRNEYGNTAHLGRFALGAATHIVAQTAGQRELLRARFGRECAVVPSPVDLEGPVARSASAPPPGYVLWIGKADEVKRPELFLELARRLSAHRFVMVLNPSDPARGRAVRASRPPNVTIVDRLPLAEAEAWVASAAALVNTSRHEGFPNTFLQAGKHGVPVASLEVDPDGLLGTTGCGLFARGDLARLADELARLLAEPGAGARLGARLREHVRANHALDRCAAALASELRRAREG